MVTGLMKVKGLPIWGTFEGCLCPEFTEKSRKREYIWIYVGIFQSNPNAAEMHQYLPFPVPSQKTFLLDPCNIFPILSSDRQLMPLEGMQFKTKPLVDSLNSNPSTRQRPGPTGGGHRVCPCPQGLCNGLGWGTS